MSNGIKTSLILGAGEIGKSLCNVLSPTHPVWILDKGETLKEEIVVDILHICFPYSDKFTEYVKKYVDKYKPKITVIHSTVPVGTTIKCGANVAHSPVRGKHPHLEEGILTFVKEIGCNSRNIGAELQEYFDQAGIPANYEGKRPDETELAKIMSTTYYGWNIAFCKGMKDICDQYDLDFEYVYTKWNKDYNDGYKQFGDEKFVRPVLEPMPGKIGGHCVVQNCHLEENDFTKLVRNFNDSYEDIDTV